MSPAKETVEPVHVIAFPRDLAAGEPLDGAIRDGARAVRVEAAGFVRPAGLVALGLGCLQALRSRVTLTIARSRSAATDSYLELSGFYDFLTRQGAGISGSRKSSVGLEPLTGMREVQSRDEAEHAVSQCVESLRRHGIRQSDCERLGEALRCGFTATSPSGKRATLFAAERYTDEPGWARIEVGMGSLDSAVDSDAWAQLERALVIWGSRHQKIGRGPMAGLVEQVLARGPGVLELWSEGRTISASTRAGSTGGLARSSTGIRLALILNAVRAA